MQLVPEVSVNTVGAAGPTNQTFYLDQSLDESVNWSIQENQSEDNLHPILVFLQVSKSFFIRFICVMFIFKDLWKNNKFALKIGFFYCIMDANIQSRTFSGPDEKPGLIYKQKNLKLFFFRAL